MFRTACVVIFLAGCPASAASLHPASVEQFFVEPQKAANLRWTSEPAGEQAALDYVLRDYAGGEIGSGRATQLASGEIDAQVLLKPGFFEIEFPAAQQRFGIVALPARQGDADRFFAIDGALSWLVGDDAIRRGLIRAADRVGISMIRERLTWGGVHPAGDRWDWEGRLRFDTLRNEYRRQSVPVLEMAHDSPKWLGLVGKYPDDLCGAAISWRQIAQRWSPAWGALEVWNEPDIFFGDNLPGDQYAAYAKAVAYGMREAKVATPVVGGVVAHYHRAFLEACGQSGLLEANNAFSFHTYGNAMEMEGLVGRYRQWLAEHGQKDLPLWITECGRPWKKGPQRPPVDQDAASALDITMKAVEARACGVARYFAFVYPFYEENDNNFGMMDRRATPLRSLAAYAQAIRALRGARYLGDLQTGKASVRRARVFQLPADGKAADRAVVVLYTGRVDAAAKIEIGLNVIRVEGIDGRELASQPDGSVPVPDGLAYVWLDPGKLGPRLIRDTPAARLIPDSPEVATAQRKTFPVVLRYQIDSQLVQATSEGYRLKQPSPQQTPIRIRAFNLSEDRRSISVALRGAGLTPQSANLEPRSSKDFAWSVDLSGSFAKQGSTSLEIVAQEEGQNLDRLFLRFYGEPTLQQVLSSRGQWSRLPINELTRWKSNVAGIGELRMSSTKEAAWRMEVKFKPGDRWAYPYFDLPENVQLQQYKGLAIRARCTKPAAVRVFLWEGKSGVGYISAGSIVPADGQWHTAIVDFRDLAVSSANAPDADGRLDLAQVRRISIGMNSQADDNLLEVSDVCAIGE